MTGRWAHRLRQVVNHLDPRPLPATDLAWVDRHLSGAEKMLFLALRRSDQRHSIAVAMDVYAASHLSLRERWLLARAGLLHDVGKAGEKAGLVARTANVLWGGRRVPWAPPGLSEAVERLRAHPVRGAAWLRKARTEPGVVALVSWHESPLEEAQFPFAMRHLLELLQAADARH